MSPDDTALQEAILAESKKGQAPSVQEALINVVLNLSRRMKRVEVIGVAVLAMTSGLLGKDLLLPLFLKILGP